MNSRRYLKNDMTSDLILFAGQHGMFDLQNEMTFMKVPKTLMKQLKFYLLNVGCL